MKIKLTKIGDVHIFRHFHRHLGHIHQKIVAVHCRLFDFPIFFIAKIQIPIRHSLNVRIIRYTLAYKNKTSLQRDLVKEQNSAMIIALMVDRSSKHLFEKIKKRKQSLTRRNLIYFELAHVLAHYCMYVCMWNIR